MGVSMLMKPFSSNHSRMAEITVARMRRMAHWLGMRIHRCRLSSAKSTPCSLSAIG